MDSTDSETDAPHGTTNRHSWASSDSESNEYLYKMAKNRHKLRFQQQKKPEHYPHSGIALQTRRATEQDSKQSKHFPVQENYDRVSRKRQRHQRNSGTESLFIGGALTNGHVSKRTIPNGIRDDDLIAVEGDDEGDDSDAIV
jgi:hypothetical protein